MAVSFIDGGNRSTQRKPVASHWQTTSHNVVHNEYTSPWTLLYSILLKPYYILVLLTILIYIFYLPYAMAAGSLLRLHHPSIVTACMLVLSNWMVWWWSRFSYISPITLILWCPLPHTKSTYWTSRSGDNTKIYLFTWHWKLIWHSSRVINQIALIA